MTQDDEIIETTTSPAGERLREAREAKGLSLEELASQTRIPLRHLQSLEQGDWARLPAPTYRSASRRATPARSASIAMKLRMI